MTAGIDRKLDDALFNVLCYFAPSRAISEEAREIAGIARVEPLGRRERVHQIVELIDEHGWHNVRDHEILRAFAFTPDPKSRRLARKVGRKRLARKTIPGPDARI